MLEDIEKTIAESWVLAARDLGIRLTSPFILVQGGQEYQFIALLPDFGSLSGALVCSFDKWNLYKHAASSEGFYCSGLAEIYAHYERGLFVDTLNDWGWYGPAEETPSWYTGEPW